MNVAIPCPLISATLPHLVKFPVIAARTHTLLHRHSFIEIAVATLAKEDYSMSRVPVSAKATLFTWYIYNCRQVLIVPKSLSMCSLTLNYG